jgi:hypothetical protein
VKGTTLREPPLPGYGQPPLGARAPVPQLLDARPDRIRHGTQPAPGIPAAASPSSSDTTAGSPVSETPERGRP